MKFNFNIVIHSFILILMNKIINLLLWLIYSFYVTGPSLKYIELPIELITHTVLQELAYKCTSLTHMLLDFSTAMQLHDFSDLQTFPSRLRTMCICLSEVIFMEGFMRKIYNFINGLEVLHLIGTEYFFTREKCNYQKYNHKFCYKLKFYLIRKNPVKILDFDIFL